MDILTSRKHPAGCLYALDTDTIIYYLEQHSRYYQTAKTIFKKIESGEFSAVISSLVFAELLVPTFRTGDPQRAEKIVRILTNYPNLKVVSLSAEISTAAARLRADYNLRTPDAIHVATALETGANGIITNDKGLLRIATNDFKILLFDE